MVRGLHFLRSRFTDRENIGDLLNAKEFPGDGSREGLPIKLPTFPGRVTPRRRQPNATRRRIG